MMRNKSKKTKNVKTEEGELEVENSSKFKAKDTNIIRLMELCQKKNLKQWLLRSMISKATTINKVPIVSAKIFIFLACTFIDLILFFFLIRRRRKSCFPSREQKQELLNSHHITSHLSFISKLSRDSSIFTHPRTIILLLYWFNFLLALN